MTAATNVVGVSTTRRTIRIPRVAWLGVGVLGLLVVASIIGPWLSPYDAAATVGTANAAPSAHHLLGTTGQGQDVATHMLSGGRLSLGLGAIVAATTTLTGLVVGIGAAYFGGRVDAVASVVINVFLVLPGLPLAVVLAAFLPAGPASIVLVLCMTGWAFGARLFRSMALSLRNREYVAAAESCGQGRIAVMATQILPNMASVLAAFFVNQVVYAITAEASLEFLGLGNAATVSWGTMLFWAQNNASLLLGYWWQFLVPGLAIAVTASALVLVNFSMDQASNPRLRAQELLHQFVGTGLRTSSLLTPVVRRPHTPSAQSTPVSPQSTTGKES